MHPWGPEFRVEVGDEVGRWRVLEPAERSEHREGRWLCECSCGTRRVVAQTNLRSGRSRSCGCAPRRRAA